MKEKRSKKLVAGNSPQLILQLMAEILHQLSVEVGSLSYIIYKVLKIPGAWEWEFWTINFLWRDKNLHPPQFCPALKPTAVPPCMSGTVQASVKSQQVGGDRFAMMLLGRSQNQKYTTCINLYQLTHTTFIYIFFLLSSHLLDMTREHSNMQKHACFL